MKTLVIIPARGGSKGIPNKNIKELAGVPLLHYTIDAARVFTTDDHICLSSDSDSIIECAQQKGLGVFFKRPAELATDTAGTREVILHAIDFFRSIGRNYQRVLLMQPTSPFRLKSDILSFQDSYDDSLDMVVSVGVSSLNPYYTLFEESNDGLLYKSKSSNFSRRQDIPPVYFYNGSLYLINVRSLKEKPISSFTKVKKYVMEELYCQDIDTPLDWLLCETILKAGMLRQDLG